MILLWANLSVRAQQADENFTHHSPGVMTFGGDVGVKDRRVFFPQMKFPLKTGPEAGDDGKPLRAFANSQVFIPPGFETNDPRLYVYPWTDTLCESKHVGGPMPLCPNASHSGHQGEDIRPNAPNNATFDVIAWVDGIVTFVSATGTSEVNIRDAENNGNECVYLHLRPAPNLRVGQKVNKGDVIGKVSNLMTGGGTSIHLHFECKATHPDLRVKMKMPIYTSMISAYRREWELSDMIDSGVLLRDPERELDPGVSPPPGSGADCGEPLASPLGATKDRPFRARYTHNCSEMGLTLDTATQHMEIVYVRPKQSLQQSTERNPALVSGKLASNGDFAGQAINFNSACGDPKFDVAGKVDFSDTEIILEGDRQPLGSGCATFGSPRHEVLRFATLASPLPTTDLPPAQDLNCPFALPAGQQPVVVDGREIPPKSERSCNFTALTVPGGLSFSQMPRYIREWPGVRKDILIDRNEDQIVTFQTAETGVGGWWYWLTQRAVNGPNLSKRGFGVNGKPTMSAVARAIAGADRSDDFVRRTYLSPYLIFASEFFGRTIAGTEQLDLSVPDVRWNLARTMFRLESGRAPVVSRKQFDCGIQLGNDVLVDFMRANVEGSATPPVNFTSFKTLASYINCGGTGSSTNPSTSEEVETLDQAKDQIRDLTSRIVELQQSLADRDHKLQLANIQIIDLQRKLAELTVAPPPAGSSGDNSMQTRILALQRALQLTNQMFDSQRELCKLNQATCTQN
ncbi:peptidoglycan DD-metalloendopeptidase family protein (plasmid) [Rhizobium leguminosarum]